MYLWLDISYVKLKNKSLIVNVVFVPVSVCICIFFFYLYVVKIITLESSKCNILMYYDGQNG